MILTLFEVSLYNLTSIKWKMLVDRFCVFLCKGCSFVNAPIHTCWKNVKRAVAQGQQHECLELDSLLKKTWTLAVASVRLSLRRYKIQLGQLVVAVKLLLECFPTREFSQMWHILSLAPRAPYVCSNYLSLLCLWCLWILNKKALILQQSV